MENLIEQLRPLENNTLLALSGDNIPGLRFPVGVCFDGSAVCRKWSLGNHDPYLPRGINTKEGANEDGRNFRHHVFDNDSVTDLAGIDLLDRIVPRLRY